MQNIIPTITHSELRSKHVAMWGEAKVAANEADVARRFAHLGQPFLKSISAVR